MDDTLYTATHLANIEQITVNQEHIQDSIASEENGQ